MYKYKDVHILYILVLINCIIVMVSKSSPYYRFITHSRYRLALKLFFAPIYKSCSYKCNHYMVYQSCLVGPSNFDIHLGLVAVQLCMPCINKAANNVFCMPKIAQPPQRRLLSSFFQRLPSLVRVELGFRSDSQIKLVFYLKL